MSIRSQEWRHPGVNTELSLGERIADAVVDFFGSWTFVLIQTLLVIAWMAYNVTVLPWVWAHHFDPYPFILLNLAFSTQAAYAAPLVMIAQKRNAQMDGERDAYDHQLLRKMADHMGVEL